MEWFRWFHGAVSDDKWPLIARRSGQSVAVVIAVWAGLLECASQSEVRGCVEEFDPESMDAMLGLENGSCQAVLNALSHGRRPRIKNNHIVNWSKRQPQRERNLEEAKSTERVKKYRERQKELQSTILNSNNTHETQCNAHETPRNNYETLRNRPETPLEHQKQPRTEQSREEESIYNNSTLSKELSMSCARAKGGEKNVVCELTPADKSFGENAPLGAASLHAAGVGSEPYAPSKEASGLATGLATGLESGLALGLASPGLEFKELRDFYNLHGRSEAPLAGFGEYRQLRASAWPGCEVIYNSIKAHKLADKQWKQGFAPGLAKFLREGWWQKNPCTQKSSNTHAEAKLKADEIIMKNAEVSRKILEAENGKFI